MAWIETSRKRTVFGNKRVVIIRGTVASGDTSAVINTGLNQIDSVDPRFKDLLDRTIGSAETGSNITLSFTNPAATKIVEVQVIGA